MTEQVVVHQPKATRDLFTKPGHMPGPIQELQLQLINAVHRIDLRIERGQRVTEREWHLIHIKELELLDLWHKFNNGHMD